MTSAPAPVLDFNSFLPEGVSLYDFQQVGVAYALVTGRCIIGDEMGLGKTIQALTVLAVKNAFPAVVVCPASLKGNWKREIERALPGRSVKVLTGRKASADQLDADITVVNYDILAAWEAALGSPQALVLDESHYAKNKDAARTKAALALASRVPADGVVLGLTGTPLLNRPQELLAQLQILGRLTDITGPANKPEGKFLFRYCGPENNGYGYTFTGASNTEELNTRLRGTCLIRRLRADALGTNDTVRIPAYMSLNGALDTYRKAEADFIGYLKETEGVAAANKARQAEAIARLTKLRVLCGLAKVPATIEWIENWLDSNEGKAIVVFAWHREVQEALVAAFPGSAYILGGQNVKTTEAQKERFQAGATRIIVCSIQAAKEGHTLTAASDVLFVEQPWNPGTQQQAEDRVNRIGQTAKQCFAYSALAEDTVDEMVYELIETKRRTFQAVADGTPFDADDANVVGAVIDYLREKGR
jgi:SWI/SNF-related matrix-associated actin-dependent regulator of chromatin subfamily A-like protein 1